MSATTIQWFVLLAFFLLFAAAMVGEIAWLVTKKWATTGKASALVLISNIISLIIGSMIVGALMLLIFMMIMGPSGRGSDAPEIAYVLGVFFVILVPPLLLFAIKRIMLALLKIRSGAPAWKYSAVSTVLTFLITLVPTGVFIYFISRK